MRYLISGIVLTLFSWILAWSQFSELSVYYFPPLWLGYVLTINGISEYFYHNSLIRRMGWWFLVLFGLSIPMWWFFEYINLFLQNWYYLVPELMNPTEIFWLKNISFSTVIPAVFSTAFLFLQFVHWKKREANVDSMAVAPSKLVLAAVVGLTLFPLMALYPREFFPFLWVAPLLIIDPINYRFGFPSLISTLKKKDMKLIFAFAFGTLFTGFFWEMWNFYSFPKWEYSIPYVDFFRIFEMPILGYLGYLPFGFAVFSFVSLVLSLIERWAGHRLMSI